MPQMGQVASAIMAKRDVREGRPVLLVCKPRDLQLSQGLLGKILLNFDNSVLCAAGARGKFTNAYDLVEHEDGQVVVLEVPLRGGLTDAKIARRARLIFRRSVREHDLDTARVSEARKGEPHPVHALSRANG